MLTFKINERNKKIYFYVSSFACQIDTNQVMFKNPIITIINFLVANVIFVSF
jgi:hypothetical protein